MTKPSIPKGTRDFLPDTMVKRNYIFDTIKKSFVKYGFLPIETPSMEKTATLMGKYGEEGDRLIFKILNSGNFFNKVMLDKHEVEELENFRKKQGVNEWIPASQVLNYKNHLNKLSEKALRYDLTVPFARFVVQHQNDITFPFKRYQIQPVWRADRPQKGRYREFYQCDADIIGTDSLLCEVELVQLLDEVLSNLTIPGVTIKINNRKVLAGIAEVTDQADKIIPMTVALDKLDKIGEERVIEELQAREINDTAIEKIKPLFQLSGDFTEKIGILRTMLQASEIGNKGLDELEYVFNCIENLGLNDTQLEFDVTLARGLNYYTGAIFEVKTNQVDIGSICGGGRYDDLTGIFGLKDVSGVGVSFGVDRIYDVMNELDLFSSLSGAITEVLLINFGEDQTEGLRIVNQLRKADINSELYPDASPLKKQMKYANSKGIPYVLFLGVEELQSGQFNLKNMISGEQQKLNIDNIINLLIDK